jgi:hypothetical protein
MKPLATQISIGIVATLCVAAIGGGAWWSSRPQPEQRSLASRLPADVVLAYVSRPGSGDGPALMEWMMEVSPSLPPIRDVDAAATDAAAVRMADGTEGWIIRTDDGQGAVGFGGSDPALAPLLDAPGAKLDDDAAFRDLRWNDDAPWGYVAFPLAASDDSSLETLLALNSPLGVRRTPSVITLRVSTPDSNGFASWSGTPSASVPNLRHTILLPAWTDIDALSPVLADDARIVIEALGRTLLDDVAPGMSPRYDLSLLLDTPSVLQIGSDGDDAPFVLEGRGRNAADTERVLRTMHARFGATRGGAKVKTVSAEGFSFETISVADAGATEERTDGEWTVLETETEDGSFASAWNGAQFVLTTAPASLFVSSDDASSVTATVIDWESARNALEPLWPSLRTEGDLRVGMRGGPGYAEWSLEPVSGL